METSAATTHVLPQHLVSRLECKQGAVRAVRFNVDGQYCITCGSDKSVKLWNPKRNLLLKAYTGHGYEVLDACGSCDNSTIASCGMDKMVIVWEVTSGLASRKFRGHAATVNCVRFNEDSSVVVSGSVDGRVKCWDTRAKRATEPIQSLEECKDSVTSLDVSDHEILVGCADSKVRRYDLRNGQLLTDDVRKMVSSVKFTKDGQCILVSLSGGVIRLLDKSTGEILQTYSGHVNKEYRIESVLDQTDQVVLSGSEDGCVYCWDLVEGTKIGQIDHSKHLATGGRAQFTIHSLSFHPKQCELMTATRGTVCLWSSEVPESQTSA